MKVEDFLSNFQDESPQRYYSFETYVLGLLQHELEKTGRELQISTEQRGRWDAYSESGILEIDGPTIIEVKTHIFRDYVEKIIKRIIDHRNEHPELEVRNLLIISSKKTSGSRYSDILSAIVPNDSPFKVFIWGVDEIDKIVAQNKKFASELTNSIFKARVTGIGTRPRVDWKTARAEIIQRIREQYKSGQFALFLGAGVSSSAGVPDWNSLMKSLLVDFLATEYLSNKDNTPEDVEEVAERFKMIDTQSALVSARYIRLGLNKNTDNKKFIRETTKNLYKVKGRNPSLTSDLIKSIASMSASRRTGAKVRSIVTYNFDDLIERQMKSSGVPIKVVFADVDINDPELLPIYHVHGFLPESRSDYSEIDKSTLVFSEEGYHQIYSDPYHWSNLVQLTALRENHCLMIGLSMNDPNLRRLLEIAARNVENTKHYVFLRRIDYEKFVYENKVKQINNESLALNFLNTHHVINEEIMKELGVTILWFEEFREIPEILDSISAL